MPNLADYILPLAVLGILGLGALKKVPVFDAFVTGATKALKLIASIFPYLAGIFICIVLLNQSPLGDGLDSMLSPVLTALGVPSPLTRLFVIRPLSGAGSLAVLEDIYARYGVDSYVGRCASVLVGGSETVFYVLAVYFAGAKGKKLRYALPVALAVTFFSSVLACWVCRVM